MSEASVALTLFEGCAAAARQERLVGLLAVLLRSCEERGLQFHEALLRAEDLIEDARPKVARPSPEPIPPTPAVEKPAPKPPQTNRTSKICDSCGEPYRIWGMHLRYHPTCAEQKS